ncbi:MAG: lytic transglycosylase domain-containing protein, partial [Pseudomonadota bacterium]|nr:lytic transglycosylase domain-containing protein [Pseudomonadota bacterium]
GLALLTPARLAVALPSVARAAADPTLSALGEAAARRAATAEDVPLPLLRAIALAETGRTRDGRLPPWPWTVNMEGEGRWFDAPGPLLDWVRARQAAGARSFDLGCFQVNHLWHGQAFDSLDRMLDPDENARYAARFLRALRDETGSWETAVGHYHSRTPDLAAGYRARVLRLAALPAPDVPAGRSGTRRGAPPGGSLLADPGEAPSLRLFASLSPEARRRAAAAAAADDARADAAAASLAHAWLSAAADPPRISGPNRTGPRTGSGREGLLRRARPLLGPGGR